MNAFGAMVTDADTIPLLRNMEFWLRGGRLLRISRRFPVRNLKKTMTIAQRIVMDMRPIWSILQLVADEREYVHLSSLRI
jgi:hypothetical protein